MKCTDAGAAALALMLAGCGGSSDSAQEPTGGSSEAAAHASAEATEGGDAANESAASTIAASTSPRPAAFAQCATCHTAEAGEPAMIGPNLYGIGGRAAATSEAFAYSQAMRDSGLVWDAANLDAFITDPRGVVPGTRMAFGGVADAAKRKEIVAYLMSLD